MAKSIDFLTKDNISINNNEYINNSVINRGLLRLLENDKKLNSWIRKIGVSDTDISEDFLVNLIVAGSNVKIDKVSSNGDEKIKISVIDPNTQQTITNGTVNSNSSIVTSNNIVAYADSTGEVIKDSGIPVSQISNNKTNITSVSDQVTLNTSQITSLQNSVGSSIDNLVQRYYIDLNSANTLTIQDIYKGTPVAGDTRTNPTYVQTSLGSPSTNPTWDFNIPTNVNFFTIKNSADNWTYVNEVSPLYSEFLNIDTTIHVVKINNIWYTFSVKNGGKPSNIDLYLYSKPVFILEDIIIRKYINTAEGRGFLIKSTNNSKFQIEAGGNASYVGFYVQMFKNVPKEFIL